MTLCQRKTQRGHGSPRRGVALLLVLAAVVSSVTACAVLVQIAMMRETVQRTQSDVHLAGDLRIAAESAIDHWLVHASGDVVLAENVTSPRVDVLRDVIYLEDGRTAAIVVTAWDQCGMATPAEAIGGLRHRTPSTIRSALESVPAGDAPGLDRYVRFAQDRDDASAFPKAAHESPIRTFSESSDDRRSLPTKRTLNSVDAANIASSEHSAIGAYVATHRPATINIQTAPLDFLEAALKAAGRGGIEQIREARAEGRAAAAPPAPSNARSDSYGLQESLKFAAASTAWSFRVDVTVNQVQQSWWLVYTRTGRSWKCVQRLAIQE